MCHKKYFTNQQTISKTPIYDTSRLKRIDCPLFDFT